jgi:hypothetical protein
MGPKPHSCNYETLFLGRTGIGRSGQVGAKRNERKRIFFHEKGSANSFEHMTPRDIQKLLDELTASRRSRKTRLGSPPGNSLGSQRHGGRRVAGSEKEDD